MTAIFVTITSSFQDSIHYHMLSPELKHWVLYNRRASGTTFSKGHHTELYLSPELKHGVLYNRRASGTPSL